MNRITRAYIQTIAITVLSSGQSTSDLVDMSMDQLLEVRISSASRSQTRIRELPASVEIITRDEIQRNHYFTLVDALKDLPGIKVSQPGTGTHGEKYLMRGLWGNNYAKILINGIPICPSAVDGMPIGEQITMKNVERIEVIYGPAAALYGADALSGIINIITRNPDDNTLAADITVGSTGIRQRDHIYSGSRFYSNVSRNDLNIALFGGISNRNRMNISRKEGAFADSTLFGEPVTVGSLPSESHTVGLELNYRDFHLMLAERYRSDHSSLEQDSRYYVWDNPELTYGETIRTASLQHQVFHDNLSFTSVLSYVYYRLDERSAFGMIFYPDPLYKFSGSDDILFEETAVYEATDNLELVGGISVQYSGAMPKTNDLTKPFDPAEYHPFSMDVPERGLYQSEHFGDFGFTPLTYYNIGMYTQGMYTNESMTVSAGMRYDLHSEYDNNVAPRLAALYNITSYTSIRASYNQAFRAPNPYKVYNAIAVENSDQSIYYMHIPNEDMQPEKLSAFECGFRHILSEDISAELIGYRNRITALISSRTVALNPDRYPDADRDSSTIDANSDNAESILNGADLVVTFNNIYRPMHISARAYLSYVRGKETLPNGDRISLFRNAPVYLAKLRVSAEPVTNLFLGIDNTFCSEWYSRVYSKSDLDIPDRKSDSYYTMDITCTYRVPTDNGTFGMYFLINNLFNESYGGYRFRDNPQYTRTFYGGLEVHL